VFGALGDRCAKFEADPRIDLRQDADRQSDLNELLGLCPRSGPNRTVCGAGIKPLSKCTTLSSNIPQEAPEYKAIYCPTRSYSAGHAAADVVGDQSQKVHWEVHRLRRTPQASRSAGVATRAERPGESAAVRYDAVEGGGERFLYGALPGDSTRS
jgi:hypothetical protein